MCLIYCFYNIDTHTHCCEGKVDCVVLRGVCMHVQGLRPGVGGGGGARGGGRSGGRAGKDFSTMTAWWGEKNCLWTCWFWPGHSAVSYETAAAWRHSETGGWGHELQALQVRRVWYYGKVKKKSYFSVITNIPKFITISLMALKWPLATRDRIFKYHLIIISAAKLCTKYTMPVEGATPQLKGTELNEPIYCSS